MSLLITTPVPGYNGKVGEVTFIDGKAKVDKNARELAYFRAQGYSISSADDAVEALLDGDDPERAEEVEDLTTQGGTHEDDPLVVKPVVKDGDEVALPRKSASAQTWREFATQHGGMSLDEANALSRDELVDRFVPRNDDDQEERP